MTRDRAIKKLDEVFSSPAFVVDVVDFLVENGQIVDSDWEKLSREDKLKWAEKEPD